jgi:hypothetical protein
MAREEARPTEAGSTLAGGGEATDEPPRSGPVRLLSE